MPEQLKPLVSLAGFKGADLTTEQAELDEGMASALANVDISANPRAFTLAQGRTQVQDLGIPAGYTVQAMAEFTQFSGPGTSPTETSTVSVRWIFFSAVNNSGGSFQGFYDAINGGSTHLTTLSPFTQAVQFQDTLYTNGNGGQQIKIRPWATDGTGHNLFIAPWQISVPQSFNVTFSLTAGTGLTAGTYNYAIVFASRRNDISGEGFVDSTVQYSAPIYLNFPISINSASSAVAATGSYTLFGTPTGIHFNFYTINGIGVTCPQIGGDTLAQQATADAALINANASLSSLITAAGVGNSITITANTAGSAGNSITTTGGSTGGDFIAVNQTHLSGGLDGSGNVVNVSIPAAVASFAFGTSGDEVFALLYRASTLQPVYYQVGQFPAGSPSVFTDTLPDTTISSNAQLVTSNNLPPFTFQLYQTSSTALGSSGVSLQLDYTLTNAGFSEIHKGRMWCFTMYPNNWDYETYANPATPTYFNGPLYNIALEAQLWFSSVGVGWQFDSVNGVLPIGPEQNVGNANLLSLTSTGSVPWNVGMLEDTPMGLASIGSILCALKSQTLWIVYGDTPAEFTDRLQQFNLGCLGSNTIIKGEGGIFWAAPQGFQFFNGGSPSYIGEPVRKVVSPYTNTDWAQCASFYRQRTACWSFPTKNVTYCYYVPLQQWYTLPYACTAASFAIFPNEIWAARSTASDSFIDTWFTGATDLGSTITGTWTGDVSDGGAPGYAKDYRTLVVNAPMQDAVVAVTLTIDVGTTAQTYTNTWSFDLSQGSTAHVEGIGKVTIGGNLITPRGYTAQLSLSATGPAGTIVRNVYVAGSIIRDLANTDA